MAELDGKLAMVTGVGRLRGEGSGSDGQWGKVHTRRESSYAGAT